MLFLFLVLYRLSDILQKINGTDVKTYLTESLKLSTDIAESFLKSSLNLNVVS